MAVEFLKSMILQSLLKNSNGVPNTVHKHKMRMKLAENRIFCKMLSREHKKKMKNALFERIRKDISENDIVLYMKGAPTFPKDGYSAALAEVLRGLGVAYCSVDVLEDDLLYQAVKDFANWPSVPQLYIKGAFIGGSDTVKELNASGELRALLEKNGLLP